VPAPLKRRFRWIALTAILFLGFVLRLNLSVKAFFSTFDTSTTGLMALHILEGERPLFYYGQSYMGALEAYVAALMFSIFGISTTALSLSPILFTVGWIAATYLLFDELFSARAGLAAALCTAAPGWYSLWFSMGPYGGYSNTFFFGTVFLYLAVRLAGRELLTGGRWAHAAALGVTAALGVWTNFQVFSYLVTGGLVLLVGMAPSGRRSLLARPALAGALIGLTGFIPLLKVSGWVSTGAGDWGGLSITAVPGHARIFLERLPKLFLWPVDTPGILLKASLASWLAAAALYAVKVVSERRRKARLKALVPLLFAAVFLPLYLVHPLAAAGAPRYLIPLATTVTAAFFGGGVSHRWRAVRWAAYVLLAVWTLFNTASALQTAEVRVKSKRNVVLRRTKIIEQAEEAGLRHLMILGSHNDGHNGQSLTFYAGDRVRYVSSTLERYYPAAVSAELDPRAGFIFRAGHLPKVERSLSSAGIFSFSERSFEWTTIYDMKVPHARHRSVLPGEMVIEVEGAAGGGRGGSLADRRAGTDVEGVAGGGRVTITAGLDRPRRIGALWLTSGDSSRLPRTFRVSTSMDGVEYTPVGPRHRNVLPTYISGNRVYMMGYHARTELRFSPVEARFVRVRVGREGNTSPDWSVNELFLFEHQGPSGPVADAEVEKITRSLSAEATDFTVADRWLSARLGARLASGDGPPPVFPLFNPRHRHTLISRTVAPRPGLAVVVERSVAEEAALVLEEALLPGTSLGRVDLPHYTLFTFRGPDSAFEGAGMSLQWNGHVILRDDTSGGE
jgi:hypothetical protein